MISVQVGIDEVGRGCLAGPVVACAVAFPTDYENLQIKDSKTLSPKRRERMVDVIKAECVCYGLGVVCSTLVDKIGIVPATKQAMQVAVSKLVIDATKYRCDRVVVDAVKLNNLFAPEMHPFAADRDYVAVAAASILAKVYRDELMVYLATIDDRFAWDKNKGYGTKAHTDAIVEHGKTDLHRVSFIKNYI